MDDRRVDDLSLAALGFGDVPAEAPLTYPGRPVTTPTLLTGGELHPLDLTLLERYRQRHPVIAVGSNASPAQLHHKLSGPGHPATVPMVPVLVHGIAVGCSAHIGRYGYVASAPYGHPAALTSLVVSWLDDAQLDAVDRTEVPNYQRVRLPGAEFPMVLPSGERLDAAYLYVSTHGVLTAPGDGGRPLPGGGDQSALLARLLASSARLRDLLGPDPAAWVGRAGADAAVRTAGTRLFHDEGWARPRGHDPLSTLLSREP
ncbi:hypothetical protein [Streptomyces sp. BRA346]|uniref:hypothetical protein n=1 Tax=Streptomyces sp. BRA346 TaxID=2878199 RepID=UPI0040647901